MQNQEKTQITNVWNNQNIFETGMISSHLPVGKNWVLLISKSSFIIDITTSLKPSISNMESSSSKIRFSLSLNESIDSKSARFERSGREASLEGNATAPVCCALSFCATGGIWCYKIDCNCPSRIFINWSKQSEISPTSTETDVESMPLYLSL